MLGFDDGTMLGFDEGIELGIALQLSQIVRQTSSALPVTQFLVTALSDFVFKNPQVCVTSVMPSDFKN